MDEVWFNVKELLCSLQEETHYNSAENKYWIQKCTSVMDWVCDTNYNLDVVIEDNYQYINLVDQYNEDVKFMDKDVVCKTTFKFEESKSQVPGNQCS